MHVLKNRQALLILCLLFVGTVSSSSIIPILGLFIVDGLGEPPRNIATYSVVITLSTLIANRSFGRRIDRGAAPPNFLLISIVAFLVAMATLTIYPTYIALLIVGGGFLGLANAAVSTTYTFGRMFADRSGVDSALFNSLMRMHSSLAWALGPPLAFSIVGNWGFQAAFVVSFVLGTLWLACWALTTKGAEHTLKTSPSRPATRLKADRRVFIATLPCVFISLANVLYTSAMPLYFIREVELPHFAPGISFAIKCIVEVPSIYLASKIARRVGEHRILLCAAALAVVTFLAISEVRTVQQLAVMAALEGIYYGGFLGVALTYVQSFAQGRLGMATAAYMNGLFVGSALGGVCMGLIADVSNYRTVVVAASVSALLGFVILLLDGGGKTLSQTSIDSTSGNDL